MTNVERVRRSYNINDNQYSKIMDVMDEAARAIKNGEEYTNYTLERKMVPIIKLSNPDKVIEYHAVQDIVSAFLEDGKWEKVFLTLYKDDLSQKTYIESYYEKKYGEHYGKFTIR